MVMQLFNAHRRPVGATTVGLVLFLAVQSAAGNDGSTAHDDSPSSNGRALLDSGLAEGEYVPQFYSRVVTGPLMNRSACFVCRNGSRPVAMVLMRRVGPEMRPLLRNIDRLVDRHRTSGLRSFGVLLSDDPFRSISAVQTFAFNSKVEMPLTVGTQAIGDANCQAIHSDAAVTVILYRQRRVVARYAFREDELTVSRFRDVIEDVRRLAQASEHATTADASP